MALKHDLISRKAAIEAMTADNLSWNLDSVQDDDLKRAARAAQRALARLPAAQRWIPIESRPMDEEERREWSERLGYDIEYEEALIYTSQLPDDGQEVLVCTKYGHVYIDTFYNDDGCYFENNGDMDGIVAWMPKPEPYKPKEEP